MVNTYTNIDPRKYKSHHRTPAVEGLVCIPPDFFLAGANAVFINLGSFGAVRMVGKHVASKGTVRPLAVILVVDLCTEQKWRQVHSAPCFPHPPSCTDVST